MDLHDFTNRLKVLRSIDRAELVDGGIYLDDEQWAYFRENPYGFVITIGDFVQAKLWALVESRCKPAPTPAPDLLEPGAHDPLPDAWTSAAISLKRIADALEGRGLREDFSDLR